MLIPEEHKLPLIQSLGHYNSEPEFYSLTPIYATSSEFKGTVTIGLTPLNAYDLIVQLASGNLEISDDLIEDILEVVRTYKSLINDSIKYDEPDADELEMLREDRKNLNKLIRFILLYAESKGLEIEE